MVLINCVHDPGVRITNHGTACRPEVANAGPGAVVKSICVFNLVLLLSAPVDAVTDDTNGPSLAAVPPLVETNAPDALHTLLEFGSQLRSNQIAIEQNGKEAREAAARNAELLSKGLQTIEEAFSAQRQALADRSERELQAIHSSNRVTALVGGAFAAVASLAILTIAYFQWRMSKVWAEISTVLPGGRGLGGGSGLRALGPGEERPMPGGPVGDSNVRLLRAVEQLETRVKGLEQSSAPSLRNHGSARTPEDDDGSPTTGSNGLTARVAMRIVTNDQARISALLAQGQSLLRRSDWEAALKCFDEVLALDPNHSEALVKKGATLERLKKLNEAFECYDRAIAANDSMTVAYLHKGGLCSRLERFKEALECYEKALSTHHEW